MSSSFHHHHHHVLLHPVVSRAATKALHSDLFCANLVKGPHVFFMAFISLSTVLLHVVFGLPFFLFPSGVQWSAVLTTEPGSLRITCPIHLHLLRVMIIAISSWLHLLRSSSFAIFLGQKIRRILRRHVVWKERSLFRSVSVILQHSDPYKSVESMQL